MNTSPRMHEGRRTVMAVRFSGPARRWHVVEDTLPSKTGWPTPVDHVAACGTLVHDSYVEWVDRDELKTGTLPGMAEHEVCGHCWRELHV